MLGSVTEFNRDVLLKQDIKKLIDLVIIRYSIIILVLKKSPLVTSTLFGRCA